MKVHPRDRTDASPSASDLVRIRPMRRRDLRAVLRIDAQQEHQGWSVGLYLAELRRIQDRRYLVARIDHQVTGFAGVLFQHEDAHITTISVDQDHQGRRLGTRLMLVVATHAIAHGCDNLTLEVRAGNRPAVALYRRFGLAPAGIRKNYYADINEDALIMWAHDLQSEAYGDRLRRIVATLDRPSIIEGQDA